MVFVPTKWRSPLTVLTSVRISKKWGAEWVSVRVQWMTAEQQQQESDDGLQQTVLSPPTQPVLTAVRWGGIDIAVVCYNQVIPLVSSECFLSKATRSHAVPRSFFPQIVPGRQNLHVINADTKLAIHSSAVQPLPRMHERLWVQSPALWEIGRWMDRWTDGQIDAGTIISLTRSLLHPILNINHYLAPNAGFVSLVYSL